MTFAAIADNPYTLLMIVAAVLVAFRFLIFLAKRFKRCPSYKILVIYGRCGWASRRSASTAAAPSSGP